MCTAFLPCVPECQKGAPGLLLDGCEPPCGCWELNSGPLEEQSVLLSTGPSLQPDKTVIISVLGGFVTLVWEVWELPSNICFLYKAHQYLPDTTQYGWTMVKVMECPRSFV